MPKRLQRQRYQVLTSVVARGVYTNRKFKPGDNVVFMGYTQEQVRWGNNDYPSMFVVGKSYIVESVDEHSQHTKLTILGIPGRFNSVHFNFV